MIPKTLLSLAKLKNVKYLASDFQDTCKYPSSFVVIDVEEQPEIINAWMTHLDSKYKKRPLFNAGSWKSHDIMQLWFDLEQVKMETTSKVISSSYEKAIRKLERGRVHQLGARM